MKEININVKTMHNVEVWLKRANEADFKMVKEVHNTTQPYLLGMLRDCTYKDVVDKGMGFNGLFDANMAGGMSDKDGILMNLGTGICSMITTLHATDPSGNYYKRFTGIYTAPSARSTNGNLYLGTYDLGCGDGFSNLWATVNIGSWNMSAGDILKVHWKISLAGANPYLLTKLRNALTGDSEDWFLGDNGLFNANTLGGISGKDGLYIKTSGGIIYSMITAAHPTDPSGNYYRRWQGVFTASSSISFLGNVYLGTKFNLDGHFDYPWDNKSLSAWDMNLGDILKVNWKVSFS